MLTVSSNRRNVLRPAGASIVAHLLVIAAMIAYTYRHPMRIVYSTGRGAGKPVDLVYLPGGMPNPKTPAHKPRAQAVQKEQAKAAPLVPPPPIPPVIPKTPPPKLPSVMPVAPAPSSAESASTSVVPPAEMQGPGMSLSGDADQIALTTYSPSPSPDLSALPRGVQGDVVVDVTIDRDGKVSDLTVLKTLGYGIEGTVVNTVRTWVFRPATKNGVPVASIQELLFHYGRPA